jgi:hypothetical protein
VSSCFCQLSCARLTSSLDISQQKKRVHVLALCAGAGMRKTMRGQASFNATSDR